MSEHIRGIKITVVVDTNKQTYVLDKHVSSLAEAVREIDEWEEVPR